MFAFASAWIVLIKKVKALCKQTLVFEMDFIGMTWNIHFMVCWRNKCLLFKDSTLPKNDSNCFICQVLSDTTQGVPSKGMHNSREVWASTSSPTPTDRNTVVTRAAHVLAAHKCEKRAFYWVNSGLKALIFVPHQDRVLVSFLAAVWHFSPNKAIFAITVETKQCFAWSWCKSVFAWWAGTTQ